MQLFKSERYHIKCFLEKTHDILETVTHPPMLSDILFRFEPHILNRILFWRIRCEKRAGHPPIVTRTLPIDALKIFLHLDTTMI